MNTDYVDVFYSHRPDPETPIEETMGALDHIVRSGRALYVGISNYSTEDAAKAFAILRDLKTPGVIYQGRFNMLGRQLEDSGMFEMLDSTGVGAICFSPLAQGLLSTKYLNGIPAGSRATRNHFLKEESITEGLRQKIARLDEIAGERSQTLVQMALAWILNRKGVTSVLCGASSPAQIAEFAAAPANIEFSPEELEKIDSIVLE
jgi:L-glyceraldehyde 3-phosphate reductase